MATSVSPSIPTPQTIPQVSVAVEQPPVKPKRFRIDSIDLLRGIVMVVMMLDHTRDFVHNAAFQFDPLDPTMTNVPLFFTRWITHFCAPTFVFLAGVGTYLQFARGKSKRELSRFLITRGLWLIFLELTLVRIGAFFNFELKFLLMMQVIWVIGVSMILLAGLIHLPLRAIVAFGLILVAFHNLLDSFRVQGWRGPGTAVPSVGGKLWMILHQQTAFPITGFPSPIVLVLYPLIPWVGVMALGYAFGSFYQKDPAQRRRRLLTIGGIAVGLFIVIRAINLYGDPNPWSWQPRGLVFTLLSFLNTSKYPPSLLYLLMTLGPAILALALFESSSAAASVMGFSGRVRKFFITFGRVPLFFYLLQWPTAHSISLLLHFAFGKPTHWLFQTPIDWNNIARTMGFNLAVVYLCWITGVLLLYPLCKWFAGVKQRRRDWWLSYL
jgi:uncharacterized membrane protein